MLMNTVMRRVVNLMVDRGVNHFAGKGKPADQMTDAERSQAQTAKDAVKRSRDIAKMARRIK
ncbi:MAG: hypothetical protein ACOH2M_26215 [Cypionkella sp.]